MLIELNELPAGFLDLTAPDLDDLLGGPTLIHLAGQRENPLFVSILLHGNETTGLEAVQALLRRYRGKALPRAISLFVGNVKAAHHGLRRLPEQIDYNRIWPDRDGRHNVPPSAETELAGQVVARMRERQPVAAIDVHNNTGHNPHYAAVNQLDWASLQLARRFGRGVLFFQYPPGVLAMAFAAICPAVTLECGKVGAASGARHACDYLDDCLQWAQLPSDPIASEDIDLYETAACITVPDTVSLTVGEDAPGQLHLRSDIESLNWQDLPGDTLLAQVCELDGIGFEVKDVHGGPCTETYLCRDGRDVRLRVPATPAMLTTNLRVIRQDCLCYLLKRIGLPDIRDWPRIGRTPC